MGYFMVNKPTYIWGAPSCTHTSLLAVRARVSARATHVFVWKWGDAKLSASAKQWSTTGFGASLFSKPKASACHGEGQNSTEAGRLTTDPPKTARNFHDCGGNLKGRPFTLPSQSFTDCCTMTTALAIFFGSYFGPKQSDQWLDHLQVRRDQIFCYKMG